MYAKGESVPVDYGETVKWYRKAAEQRDAFAQHNLGNMYYNGEGVSVDYVQAYAWFNLAAAQERTYGLAWRTAGVQQTDSED